MSIIIVRIIWKVAAVIQRYGFLHFAYTMSDDCRCGWYVTMKFYFRDAFYRNIRRVKASVQIEHFTNVGKGFSGKSH